MPNTHDIQEQQELLAAHRHTLSIYLRQRALQGAAFTPPSIENGIREARHNIRTIKATLRSWGAFVEDHPDDEETPLPEVDGGTGGKRAGGFLAILGLLTFFTGFGIFGYVVLSFMLQIFSALSSPSSAAPDLSAVPFQLIPIGVGLAFVGILLASLAGVNLLRKGKRPRR
jgi:hypothetical protein